MPRRKHPGPAQVDEDLRIKWTPPRKDLLITFIETHPCFWDNAAEGGTDPDYKDSLVLDFTTNILQLGSDAVPAVWRHINTMKDTFTRNLAKYVASGSEGGPCRLTPKMKQFMDRFSFYQKSIELRQSKSNLPSTKGKGGKKSYVAQGMEPIAEADISALEGLGEGADQQDMEELPSEKCLSVQENCFTGLSAAATLLKQQRPALEAKYAASTSSGKGSAKGKGSGKRERPDLSATIAKLKSKISEEEDTDTSIIFNKADVPPPPLRRSTRIAASDASEIDSPTSKLSRTARNKIKKERVLATLASYRQGKEPAHLKKDRQTTMKEAAELVHADLDTDNWPESSPGKPSKTSTPKKSAIDLDAQQDDSEQKTSSKLTAPLKPKARVQFVNLSDSDTDKNEEVEETAAVRDHPFPEGTMNKGKRTRGLPTKNEAVPTTAAKRRRTAKDLNPILEAHGLGADMNHQYLQVLEKKMDMVRDLKTDLLQERSTVACFSRIVANKLNRIPEGRLRDGVIREILELLSLAENGMWDGEPRRPPPQPPAQPIAPAVVQEQVPPPQQQVNQAHPRPQQQAQAHHQQHHQQQHQQPVQHPQQGHQSAANNYDAQQYQHAGGFIPEHQGPIAAAESVLAGMPAQHNVSPSNVNVNYFYGRTNPQGVIPTYNQM